MMTDKGVRIKALFQDLGDDNCDIIRLIRQPDKTADIPEKLLRHRMRLEVSVLLRRL